MIDNYKTLIITLRWRPAECVDGVDFEYIGNDVNKCVEFQIVCGWSTDHIVYEATK